MKDVRKLTRDNYWDYELGYWWFGDVSRFGKVLCHTELYKRIIDLPGTIAEFGVYKETILPSDNGYLVGDGVTNTTHLNSYPTSFGGITPNPTNPVIDTHTLAAMECVNYVGPNGHTDWFLPSLDEASELMLNLG